MESIRENQGDGNPFLAYLAFTAPHDPLHVPEPWLSKYRGRYDEGYEALKARRAEGAAQAGVVRSGARLPGRHAITPAWDALSSEEQARQSRMMEVYAGMVDNMDHHLGRVLDFLDDIGELENTVIIFFSDNGPNPWDSEDYPGNRDGDFMDQFDNSLDNLGKPGSNVAYGSGWAQASAGPYNYFKMTVGEGGTRSPLIVAGPQVNSGGRINDTPVTAMDAMPTLLDIAGIKHPETFNGRRVKAMMGRSMKGVAAATAERVHPEDTLFGHQGFEEHPLSGEMLGGKFVRRGDWKALFVTRPYGPNTWQLFNLAALVHNSFS